MREHSIVKVSIQFTAPETFEGIPIKLKNSSSKNGKIKIFFSEKFRLGKSLIVPEKERAKTFSR